MNLSLQTTPPIFILGPTAVGKSAVAIELALKIRGEIVSADSMSIYRGMNIGTAKPTLKERRGVPHHLLDTLTIHQACDVALFQKLACSASSEIQARGAQPVVVGGSGLYLRALTQGLFEGPGKDEKIRNELEKLNTQTLRQHLVQTDPMASQKIDAHDRKRMIRALEFFTVTGYSISKVQTQWKNDATKNLNGTFQKSILIGLNRPREELYQRCNARVDLMFAQGFIEEVQVLVKQGLKNTPTACKAIGYPEVMHFLDGELALDQTIALVKQKTRNFAKRQLTWFKKEPGMIWLNLSEKDSLTMIVERILQTSP